MTTLYLNDHEALVLEYALASALLSEHQEPGDRASVIRDLETLRALLTHPQKEKKR